MIKFNEQTGEIKVTNSTSSQTEISDEEIQKWIDSTPYYGHCTTEYKEGLEDGINWYKEQLKTK